MSVSPGTYPVCPPTDLFLVLVPSIPLWSFFLQDGEEWFQVCVAWAGVGLVLVLRELWVTVFYTHIFITWAERGRARGASLVHEKMGRDSTRA